MLAVRHVRRVTRLTWRASDDVRAVSTRADAAPDRHRTVVGGQRSGRRSARLWRLSVGSGRLTA